MSRNLRIMNYLWGPLVQDKQAVPQLDISAVVAAVDRLLRSINVGSACTDGAKLMVSVRVLVTAVQPFKKNHSFSIRSKMFFSAPILLFFAMFWGPTSARANDIYIAQSATGAANGVDCADALPYMYFNTAANWTAGAPTGTKIGPGTTVHLCGMFTGTGGQTLLTSQGSGTSGSP